MRLHAAERGEATGLGVCPAAARRPLLSDREAARLRLRRASERRDPRSRRALRRVGELLARVHRAAAGASRRQVALRLVPRRRRGFAGRGAPLDALATKGCGRQGRHSAPSPAASPRNCRRCRQCSRRRRGRIGRSGVRAGWGGSDEAPAERTRRPRPMPSSPLPLRATGHERPPAAPAATRRPAPSMAHGEASSRSDGVGQRGWSPATQAAQHAPSAHAEAISRARVGRVQECAGRRGRWWRRRGRRRGGRHRLAERNSHCCHQGACGGVGRLGANAAGA